MNAHELSELIQTHADAKKLYLEFMRVPAFSMGLYRLRAGDPDPQSLHSEDEVYYVLSGKATINVAGELRPVQAGSIIYVAANQPHQFQAIEQDLDVLVFFAPAEYTRAISDNTAGK